MFLDEMDFNLDEDVKPAVLLYGGWYKGTITEVKSDDETHAIVFKTVLDGNEDRYANDGETPVDGFHQEFKIWFPKEEDKQEMTKSGRETKYDFKLRNVYETMEKLKVPYKTAREIAEAIRNQEFVGLPVNIEIELREWEGRTFNSAKNLIAQAD